MTYLAILALVAVAYLLFRARGVAGVILSDAKMQAGDYSGALRRLRWAGMGFPNPLILHKTGLILALAGRSGEAEVCYHKALEKLEDGSPYPRERLLTSRGYTQIDLGRYAEAEQCFHRAIEAGDRTGNALDGLAELRVVQGVEAEAALAYTTQAIEHAKDRPDHRVPGAYYALRAWALALLGRGDEAGEALALAESVPEPNARTGASMHWRAGMALVAAGRSGEAREHFRKAADLDPNGKYGARSRAQLG